jgi:hypothetical protein
MPPETVPAKKEDSKPDDAAVDRLASLITAAAHKMTPPAAPVPEAKPDTSARDRYVKETTDKAQQLFDENKGGEVVRDFIEKGLDPIMAAQREDRAAMGKSNVANLRRTYGKKFTSREAIFQKVMKDYGLSYAELFDPEVAEKVWKATLIEDHDAYMKEEMDERAAAETRTRKEESERNPPPPVSPIMARIAVEDTEKDLAERHFDDDPEGREWELKQVRKYNRGKTEKEAVGNYLKQARKSEDPRFTESVGAGSRKVNICTAISDDPDPHVGWGEDAPSRRKPA